MKRICTVDHQKKAFRLAFEFLDNHCGVLSSPDDYLRLIEEMKEEDIKCAGDRLTMNLIGAVVEYVCDFSKNDSGGNAGGS